MLLQTDFATVAAHAAGVTTDAFTMAEPTPAQWLIDADGRGFVGLTKTDLAVTINALFVHPTEREMGFGERLLTDVLDMSGNMDIEAIVEARLHRWFCRHGFIAVRKLKKSAWLLRRPMEFTS